MYFVVNKTKSTVVISDLGLSLGPRQASDLDERFGREKAERSRELKKAIKAGYIGIKVKDPIIPKVQPTQVVDTEKIKQSVLLDIKNDIRDEIKKGMNGIGAGISESFLTKSLESLAQNILETQGSANFAQNFKKAVSESEIDVPINEEMMADIHARAVDKITDNIDEMHIEYAKKEVEDSVKDNADELDSLLG